MQNLFRGGRGFDRPRQTHFSANAIQGVIERESRRQRKGYWGVPRYCWREGIRRTSVRAARTARDPRFVAVTVILVSCALISAVNLGSDSTSAALGPKAVRGFVWDSLWNPVPNANVTLKTLNGAVLVKTLYCDATDPDGYYSLSFGPSDWDPGYTIEITARYSVYSIVNTTVANPAPFQWLNASLAFVIPELGGGITAGLTIASFTAMVLVVMARRRRRA